VELKQAIGPKFYQIEGGAKWITIAILISWASIAATVILGVSAFVVAIIMHSSAMLAHALSSLVDVVSSIVILWRFWGGTIASVERAQLLINREKRANILIASTLLLVAIIVVIEASVDLSKKQGPDGTVALLIIGNFSLAIYGVIAFIQYHCYKNLQSEAMKKNAIMSTTSSVLSIGIIISSAIHLHHSGVWFVDAAVALIVAVAIGSYAIKTLYSEPGWWNKQFWIQGHTENTPLNDKPIVVSDMQE